MSSSKVRLPSQAVLLAVCACSPMLHAAPYPDRPIRLILPFAPGGGADIVARVVAQHLADALKQPVVVDNRPGGGATMGTELGAHAPADGYTLVVGSNTSLAVNPAIMKVNYDPVKDFAPVALFGTQSHLMVVNPGVPAKSLREFVAIAKGRPGGLFYSSSGNGGPTHLGCELFKIVAGIDIVHVPYKGQSAAILSVIGGEAQFSMPSIASALPQVNAGKLRALAATSRTRLKVAPEVPTAGESGYPDFEVNSWTGLLAPARTPPAIVARLNQAVATALRRPEVLAKFAGDGVVPGGGTADEFAAYIKREMVTSAKVVKVAGIHAD